MRVEVEVEVSGFHLKVFLHEWKHDTIVQVF